MLHNSAQDNKEVLVHRTLLLLTSHCYHIEAPIPDNDNDTAWECYTSGTLSPEDAPPVQMPGGMMPPTLLQAAPPPEEEDDLEYADVEENPSVRSHRSNGSNGSSGSDKPNGKNGSSDSVEGHLHPPGDLHSLVQEGGVHYLNYSLAKADTPSSEVPDISKIREWSYRDLL